jgi:putative acetyltransferase
MAASPAGLAIRSASAANVPALCALANDPGYRWGRLRLPYQSVEETSRWFARLQPGDHMLVAEIAGELIGNAGLHRQRGRRSHVGIIGMGVRDAWRGHGIGTALLAALIELADNWLDLRRLELCVSRTMPPRSPSMRDSASTRRASCGPTPTGTAGT